MSNRKPRIVKVFPSVAELIDRIVVNMIARRPDNWQAIARENGHRNIVKSVVLSNPWKGNAITQARIKPFKGDQLKSQKSNGKRTGIQFETIIDVGYAAEVAVEFPADANWGIYRKQPDMDSRRNLKRAAEVIPLSDRKKRLVRIKTTAVRNNGGLKCKRSN